MKTTATLLALLSLLPSATQAGDFTDSDWVSLNAADPIHGPVLGDGVGGIYVGETTAGSSGFPYEYQLAHWDGNSWSSLGLGFAGTVAAMATNNGNLYAAGYIYHSEEPTVNYILKWDGTNLSELGPGLNYTVTAIAANGTNVYIGGGFNEAGGGPANHVARWDGTSWHPLGSGLNEWVSAILTDGNDVYVAGSFDMAGGIAASGVARWDGTNWHALGAGLANDSYPFHPVGAALAMMGNDLYVTGWFTSAGGVPASYIAKWNGSSWSALGSGLNEYATTLAVNGTDLYVGGFFSTAGSLPANNLARWNGFSWSALPAGYPRYTDYYSLVFSGTNFFVGSADRIRRRNGAGWSPVSSGISNSVLALVVSETNLYAIEQFPPAPTVYRILKRTGEGWTQIPNDFILNNIYDSTWSYAASGSNFYAAGQFSSVGGMPVSNIARWDGSSWNAMGSGLNSNVFSLFLDGTDLYVSGAFTTAGGVPANRIARWDGTNWNALGTGLDGHALKYIRAGTNLYVSGGFSMAGSVAANHIACWNGTSWSALGSGLDAQATVMAASGNDLYVAGNITTAGGTTVDKVAKWNGTSWSSVGLGWVGKYGDGVIYSLAVVDTNVYAAGSFGIAGGVPVPDGIARWDGSAWHPLGSGLSTPGWEGDARASALVAHGKDIYVAGLFTDAGGVPVRNLAKWDGNNWSAVGSGVDRWAYDLATDKAGHLFIRGEFRFAGTKSSPQIAQANIGSNIPGGRFENPTFSPLNGFSATFTDATFGQSYRIQTTADIGAGWTELTNFNYFGPTIVADPSASLGANKYYRAVSP